MIRILIADDHAIFREGLKKVLADADDLAVEGEAVDGHEVMAKVRERDWGVLVLDMSMPGKSGIELIKQIRSEKIKVPILVLSMYGEEQYAVRAIKAGASGYMTKESASSQLVEAIRKVASGGVFISSGVAERLALEFSSAKDDHPHTLLSDREYQIFRMIVSDKSLTAIAEELSLSVKTVGSHKTRIMQKLNLNGNAELIRYAVRHGITGEA
ncbi:response regulator transcription factor [Sulfuricella sp.]|uniref:response regulator transcription factor n=1 Tax=Sulfuricella sp. TaxID=2099377 RepID=UPI002C0546B1|nr:response regulator transcription factor [Sulfuricella sp.]HUX64766.1 response regulator transcription factor [Sulfuricella sp.]